LRRGWRQFCKLRVPYYGAKRSLPRVKCKTIPILYWYIMYPDSNTYSKYSRYYFDTWKMESTIRSRTTLGDDNEPLSHCWQCTQGGSLPLLSSWFTKCSLPWCAALTCMECRQALTDLRTNHTTTPGRYYFDT